MLHDNGYECALSGKWHIGAANRPQAGFDVWKALAIGGADYYFQAVLKDGKMSAIPGQYVTDYITDNAIVKISACSITGKCTYIIVTANNGISDRKVRHTCREAFNACR